MSSKKITIQAIIIILLASLFYFYEFIIQPSTSVMEQDLMRAFTIDATKLGLLSSCFYLSYTPLQLLSGLILDRYSTRVFLTCICTIFAFGVLLFANASNIYTAAMARFIMGAAASCAFISVLHLIAHWIPITRFALFAGIAEMMGAVGGLSGIWLLAILLKHSDWRTVITNLAYIGFVLALLIALVVRNNPKQYKIIESQNSKRSILLDLKIIMHSRETWTIGIYSLFIWAPILGFTALWGIPFLRISHNLDNAAAALIGSFTWIGIAVASPVIGLISDFIGKRRILMTICSLAGLVAITIVIFVTNISPVILYALMFIIGFAGAGQTLSFALIRDNNSIQTMSAANGFNNMFVVAGALVLQPLIGKILDMYWQGTMQDGVPIYSLHGYQIAFLMLSTCYLIATITSIFFIKETLCFTAWQK